MKKNNSDDARSLEELFKLLKDKNINFNIFGGINMCGEKMGININQTVTGNNYGALNAAQGDIYSTNNSTGNEAEGISDLIKQLRELIASQELREICIEDKEAVTDDLDSIEERINNDDTKIIKIKKAYQGLKSFIVKIPATLTTATLIATKANELYEKLKPLLER